MPAFEKLLTPEQIGILADWLRGDWYRPARH
jgi:mono/diheme cytochrome c family protein